MIKSQKLLAHARLVSKEVSLLFVISYRISNPLVNSLTYHAIHKTYKAPKGNCIVLHDCVDGCEQIAHTLYVTKALVVLVVGEQHVLHLLQMHIGTNVCKWRVGIRMRNVLAGEDGNIAVCAMYILLYTTDPKEWEKLVKIQVSTGTYGELTYPVLLLSPPFFLL